LAPEKQVEDLAVLGDLPRIRLVVIGDGPERERLARRLPGAHFTGVVTGNLSRTPASLDIMVHPGLHDTWEQTSRSDAGRVVPGTWVGPTHRLDEWDQPGFVFVVLLLRSGLALGGLLDLDC